MKPVPEQKTNQRFRHCERLRLRTDYDRVFRARRSSGDGVLVVYVADNGLAWSRLGLSVSRRVGNAVTRHYVRRRIREAFRLSKDTLPKGLDIICVAQVGAAEPGADFLDSLRELIHRAERRKQTGNHKPDSRHRPR